MAVQIVLEFIKAEVTRRPMTEPRPLPKKVAAAKEGGRTLSGRRQSRGGRRMGVLWGPLNL